MYKRQTIASILIVAVAILISYFAAGGTTSILDEMGGFSLSFNQGLYEMCIRDRILSVL